MKKIYKSFIAAAIGFLLVALCVQHENYKCKKMFHKYNSAYLRAMRAGTSFAVVEKDTITLGACRMKATHYMRRAHGIEAARAYAERVSRETNKKQKGGKYYKSFISL